MLDIIFIDIRENVIWTIFGYHLGCAPYPNARNVQGQPGQQTLARVRLV